MTKTLITLPCTARELENALHAVCDHHGLWDGEVTVEMDEHYKDCLVLCDRSDNTKGEDK